MLFRSILKWHEIFGLDFESAYLEIVYVYSCGLDMETMALPVHSCMNGKMREFSLQMRFIRRTNTSNTWCYFNRIKKAHKNSVQLSSCPKTLTIQFDSKCLGPIVE